VQQKASRITEAIEKNRSGWTIYPLVVNGEGIFKALQPIESKKWERLDEFWNNFRLPKVFFIVPQSSYSES
jgi:hypothetical protein